MRTSADLSVADVVRARWPALSRYAVTLTGDRTRAQALLVDVLASGDAGPDDALDDPELEVRDALARVHWQRDAGPVRDPSAAPEEPGKVLDGTGDEDRRAAERAAAREALAALPARERVALVLRLVDGLDDDQAAQVLHARAGRVRRARDTALEHAAATMTALLGRPVPPDGAALTVTDVLADGDDPDIPYADTTAAGDAARRRRRTRRVALVAGSLAVTAALAFSLVPPRPADPPDPIRSGTVEPPNLEVAAQPLHVERQGVPAPPELRELLGDILGTALRRQLPEGLVGTLQPQSGAVGAAVLVAAGRYDRRSGRPNGPIALVDFDALQYQLVEDVRPLHPDAIGVDPTFVSWIGREGVLCRDRLTGDRTGSIGEDPQGVLAVSGGRRTWQIVRGDLMHRFVAMAPGCRSPRDLRVDGRLRAFEWPWVYVVGTDGLARVDARSGERVLLDPGAGSDRGAGSVLVDGNGDRVVWVSEGRVRLHDDGKVIDLGREPFRASAQDRAVALGDRFVSVSGRVDGVTRSRVFDVSGRSTADLDVLATVVGRYLVVGRDQDVLVFPSG